MICIRFQFGRAFNNNLNTLIKIIINMQWEYNQPHEMYFHHNYVCVWVCVYLCGWDYNQR